MVVEVLQMEIVQVQDLAHPVYHQAFQEVLLEQFMLDLEAEMV